jgi:hypothetical protein
VAVALPAQNLTLHIFLQIQVAIVILLIPAQLKVAAVGKQVRAWVVIM